MADRQLVEPDMSFVRKIVGFGGDTLKKCFQCATCSVVCNLSPERSPFPRKEMIWAQWGLKDRLMKDPDVWLCHQCNDCSVYCPRGAKPGDVLAAIRNYSFTHYSAPSFLGKALSEGKYLPLLLAFPVVLFLFLLGITGHLNIPEGPIVFEKFVPHYIVDPVFIMVSILVVISLIVGVGKFWNGMKEGVHPCESKGLPVGDFIKLHVVPTIIDIFKHSKFMDCDKNKFRYLAHLLIFYSFIALAVVTGIVFLGIYFIRIEHMLPLAQLNPIKILANLGAVALIAGCTIVISNRLKEEEDKSTSSYFDWVFIIMVYAVAISGLLTELTRLADVAVIAYSLYFIHLVLVFYLIAYLPFSKFAHMIYRTVALVYSSYSQREKQMTE
ncbi:MAG: quinone-interacting membrane-bound oxidoreductase complex subunit QmoC [Thermodesulfobacteriota bacterium]|nr:quinone-interacting membrane-bound oxidoreductase complex subunit QmoC [Thermodesulfobacteriota bacterium]